MNAPAPKPQTQLTVIERAQVALQADLRKQQFTALALESKEITAITNAAGYDQCHAARMRLKTARLELTAEAKDVRDDAVKFQKGVIALEKDLIAIISPEEDRLHTIQTDHDERAERERAAKAEAETARLQQIAYKIGELQNAAPPLVGKSSAEIADAIHDITMQDVTEWAQECAPQATEAKRAALATLELLHTGTLAKEHAANEQAARLAHERFELERLRAEQEDRDRRAAEIAAKNAEQERERQAEIEARERASRIKIEAEEREARLAREEADRQAAAVREAKLAEIRQEQETERQRLQALSDQITADARAADAAERTKRAQEEAKAAALAAEQEEKQRALNAEWHRQEQEKRVIEERQRELLETDRLIVVLRQRINGMPKYAGIAKAIDDLLIPKPAKRQGGAAS